MVPTCYPVFCTYSVRPTIPIGVGLMFEPNLLLLDQFNKLLQLFINLIRLFVIIITRRE